MFITDDKKFKMFQQGNVKTGKWFLFKVFAFQKASDLTMSCLIDITYRTYDNATTAKLRGNSAMAT